MKKYKIGYTSGVYDMFHIGHLNLLKRAKEQCEFLVVGVTTDELAMYKNKVPIIPYEERKQIAKNGYQKVKEAFTIKHCLQTMLQTVFGNLL